MFKENLELLKASAPELAEKLGALDLSSTSWTETRKGQKNLSYTEGGKSYFVHSSYDVEKETEKWCDEIRKTPMKLAYVYGAGLGYSFTQLKTWLEESPDQYLVYLEDDLRVLARLLETPLGKEILNHKQVMIVDLEGSENEVESILEDLAYYYVNLPFQIVALPHYLRDKEARFLKIKMHLLHKSAYAGFAGLEFFAYGSVFFKNFYQNMLHLQDGYAAKGLFGKFKGVPAIICGAGPSLNKNFELLKTLSDRAIIFAGGSALKALTNRSLLPHFGASVDPNPAQFERMITQTGHEVPIFFKGRVYNRALRALGGPKIYLTGNNGYPITGWFEEELGIEQGEVREGHNVLHLTIDIARKMGCGPIIFVGMDLAFTGLEQYASSVVPESKISKQEITQQTNINNNAFERKDINGDPVYTLWKWVAESNYTSKFNSQFPELKLINATEGGIGAPGVENMPLEEVAEKYLTKQYDLYGQISGCLQEAKFQSFSRKDTQKLFGKLDKSLKTSLKHLEEMLETFEVLQKAIKKDDMGKIRVSGEELEKLQEKLMEEIAYRGILEPVNHVRSVFYTRRHSEIEANKNLRSERERMLERCEAHREEIATLKEAALVNLATIHNAVSDHEKEGYETSDFYMVATEEGGNENDK